MTPFRVLRMTPRGARSRLVAAALGVAIGAFAPSAAMAQGPAPDDLGIPAATLAASETADGYAFWVFPEDRRGGATALVLRHGRVMYRWPLRGPLPPAPDGQPEDGPRWYPVTDLTGNGHGTVHIQDMTSRSTTRHVILDLAPDGVTELFNRSLHFTERLDWADSDGDGVREPRVSGGQMMPGGGREEGLRRPLSLE
ncbi:hypothetical protein [Roseospira navarrensis]|uniref:Uncharacterized protein n=1 Tax=Roseospira navarrensis TaxID=140058 RepID=A0A7X1ZFD7_9PROT|nr:hypothetical protein [Roseospira navarrensis]MQX37496.1 hypothetical protein [Roseospira navarrensis]